jgi:HK97 family phage prohead protease
MDLIRKRTLTEVDAVEDGDVRKVTFTVSTGSLDRDGDTINPEGWDLTHYRKNPVVLWHHDPTIPPVAKSESIDVVDGRLKAVTVFPKKGDYPFADTIYNLVSGGFVNMASVGFHPLEKEPTEKGFNYQKQELYEWSILPVGSNRDALAEAKAAGIDIAPVVKWATDFLKTHGDDVVAKSLTAVPAPPADPGATLDGGDHAGAGAVSKKIEQRGDKWVVLSMDGEVLGEHDTEEDAKAQLAAIEANKSTPMCPACVKAANDGEPPKDCERCDTMRKNAVSIDVKQPMPLEDGMEDGEGEDERPRLVDDILAELDAEEQKREERWRLEDALRISLNSINEYATDQERQGLIEQTVSQFAAKYEAAKALADMESLAKELFPGVTKQDGEVVPEGLPPFGNPDVDAAMSTLHGVVVEALGMTDPQERANALKEGLEAFAVVVMEAVAPTAEPPAEPGEGEGEGEGAVPEQLRGVVDILEKVGRVLSGKNEARLRDALSNLADVLSALPEVDADEGDDGKVGIADLVKAITPDGTTDDELEAELQKTYGLGKDDLRGLVGVAVKEAVNHGRTQMDGRLPD